MKWLENALFAPMLCDLSKGTTRQQFSGEKNGWICGEKLFHPSEEWIGFLMRAKSAALASGLSNQVANGIIGSLEEFKSNITEHSRSPNSGYVVFTSTADKFEFVVADYGIGVLSSLKESSKYSHLSDYSEALKLAISDGVSRHSELGRGNGFRPLLVGLANIANRVRFRSGDYVHEFVKTSPTEIQSSTIERVYLKGFMCAVEF